MERLKGDDLMAVIPQFLEGAAYGVLNDVISSFNSNEGYAQPNKYEVMIFPPTPPPTRGENYSTGKISLITSDEKRKISMRCESVTLPGRNLSSTPDANVHGPVREVVNNVNYADSVAMVFQASADLRERVFFEKWQELAFNPRTWNVGYYNDYASGTVEIYLLDKNDKTRYGLKLMECFPKSIGPTDLSYASTNEMIKLPISMNFRYWETLDTAQTENTTPPDFHHKNLIRSTASPAVFKLPGRPGGRPHGPHE